MPKKKNNNGNGKRKSIHLNIYEIAGVIKVLNGLDEGKPGTGRVSDKLISGDLKGIMASLNEGVDYLYSAEGLKNLGKVTAVNAAKKQVSRSFRVRTPGISVGGLRIST